MTPQKAMAVETRIRWKTSNMVGEHSAAAHRPAGTTIATMGAGAVCASVRLRPSRTSAAPRPRQGATMIRLLAHAFSFVASSTLVLAQQPAAPAPAPAKPAAAPAAPAPIGEKAVGEMEYFELDSNVLGQKLNVGVYLPPDYDAS